MEFLFVQANDPTSLPEAVVLLDFEGERRADLAKLAPFIYDSGELSGKFLDFTLLHSPAGFTANRVLIAGAGKRGKFDTAMLRKLAGASLRFLKIKSVKSLTFFLDESLVSEANISAVAEGAISGNWEPDLLKTDKSAKKSLDSVSLAIPAVTPELTAAFDLGKILGDAATLTRDIAVEPPNRLTPLALASRARAMADAAGLAIDVLDLDRMTQLGMGALLGVAQGSTNPPAFIVIEYRPEAATSTTHLALIGKGVTFDTGGISIKPSEGMEKMKYDMCGAAAVIGAMYAIAKLKPTIAVTGLIPTVENMPGGNAFRPGDILVSYAGKTVEVLNTDAEGRLILIDAITFAKKMGATHMVDTATLTGAIAVALGTVASGVFTNSDELLAQWMAAAKTSGELMWHMPLFDEYRDQLKTVYADIQNIGTRWGGACTAAMFLKEFVEDTPWVHVDIAGTAWVDEAKPHIAKGPTATPLGAFVHLAMNWPKS